MLDTNPRHMVYEEGKIADNGRDIECRRLINDVFREYGVHDISYIFIPFRHRNKQQYINQQIKLVLESMTDEDHVIIFFQGSAHFDGEIVEIQDDAGPNADGIGNFDGCNYSIMFQNHKEINFYQIFEMMKGSDANIKAKQAERDGLLAQGRSQRDITDDDIEELVLQKHHGVSAIVECDITLLWDASFPDMIVKEFRRPRGCTDVIARPEGAKDSHGRPLSGEDWWTKQLAKYLAQLLTNFEQTYGHYTANFSFVELIKRFGKDRHNSTHHYFTDCAKPKAKATKVISHPEICLEALREGKLQHIRKVLQDVTTHTEADEEAEEESAAMPTIATASQIPDPSHVPMGADAACRQTPSAFSDEGYGGRDEDKSSLFMPK
ncbi:hypothetical protein CB0940_09829 [Cercospora beticola]|uniref:Uncharacterized protein n=1 Tax=Cercospora beticola TaxID=122368 RepID=A0A2G5HJ40_CERBT|nr:hypothetical protein CB0940_09829 [Cercospora beticola]PIA92223.1 hypothetical protein CB0940_09829 [Cercospora beticola]WPB05825.1 hypothetical protein RHO25_010479 [Cercospora beticola]